MDVAALVRVLACVSHTCKRGEDSVTFCYGGGGSIGTVLLCATRRSIRDGGAHKHRKRLSWHPPSSQQMVTVLHFYM